jgi:hypothetical protein
MVHVIQLASGAFMRVLGVKVCTRSSEAHERDQQIGKNESIDIGKSHTVRNEGNARINNVLAMRPGLAKMIEIVHISRYFESPETDLDIVVIAGCIDSADTWSSKRDHGWSKSKCPYHGISDY